MDMNLLYAILIALIPVVITIIMSKVYNVIHGLITFLVTGYLLIFCLSIFGGNLPTEISGYFIDTNSLYICINQFVIDALKVAGLGDLLKEPFGVYIVLAMFVVLYVISQVISSALRKKRVEKINSLKRQVKRY